MKSVCIFFLIPGIAYGGSIAVSGSPQPLIVSKARAGKEPESAIDSSTTYTLQVSPNATAILSVSIDSPMPEGTNLFLSLIPPGQAKSFPAIPLKTTPQIILNQIVTGIYKDLSIIYEYKATVSAGIVPLSTKNIVFTLMENTP